MVSAASFLIRLTSTSSRTTWFFGKAPKLGRARVVLPENFLLKYQVERINLKLLKRLFRSSELTEPPVEETGGHVVE